MSAASVDPLFLSFQLALAGRYSIDRELGRGGMGIVYLAREVHLDRLVAIKLLPPERAAQPALRERFLREARLAAKLSHPNIIPIHAVEDTNGFVFYVMAFVDGETLANRVRTRGPLPSSEAARVLREVAWALASAHAQGLVHRDVKPDNILLETASGRVLVADFGIAAATGEAGVDGIAGTPEFMSPEQALGGHIDARSDLYGLGATAFYAFSGRFPFEGRSPTEILAKQVTEPAPPLSSVGVTVPRKLASLVDRCLAKEPDHRPASAQALAEQLGLALEQRRELPAALRAFVKRYGRLDGGGTLIAGMAVPWAAVVVSMWFGATAGFTTLIVGAGAGSFAYMIAAARRLSLLGFARQDLAPAYAAEIEQAREELGVERQARASLVEHTLRVAAKVMLAVGVGAGVLVPVALMTHSRALLEVVAPLSAMSLGFSSLAAIGWLAFVQRRHDVDTAFWKKIWLGPVGRLAFSIARKLLGDRRPGPAMTHRATELSLGMAAEQLFESLPKESRLALGDLPSVLQRLQSDAQTLRKRYDEMQEVMADAGDAATSPQYAELRALRDDVHAKLGQAVGALETIRLNLLRLHAGSATVAGITTHLGLAAEVSEGVQRLIAAQDEVERVMRFPRTASATPV